jgi:hypothetical protein
VLAAAIRANAQAIVTFNPQDFPDHVLERYDIEAKHADEFILDSIDIASGAVIKWISDQSAALRNPPILVPTPGTRSRELRAGFPQHRKASVAHSLTSGRRYRCQFPTR